MTNTHNHFSRRIFLHRTAGTFAKVISILLLFAVSGHAISQNEGRWYNVEVLIFKRLGSEAFNEEIWRRDIDLKYPDNYRYLQPRSGKKLRQLTLIPENRMRLRSYKFALDKNENYQPLLHQAWTQQMWGEDSAPAIIIQGGESKGGIHELSGSIKIHISRYLHFITDLWLITGEANQAAPEESPLKANDSTESLSTAGPVTTAAKIPWPVIPPPPVINATEPTNRAVNRYPVATLRDSRRMRSKELHYVDHPLLGVLVLITPL